MGYVSPGVQPVKYVKTLEGNYAHLFQFTDDGMYVVKFYKVREYRKREVVNEWLAAKLGEILGLPVLPVAAVDMPQNHFRKSPKAAGERTGREHISPFLI